MPGCSRLARGSITAVRRNSRARILHCITTLDLGGEQRYLARIANRIDGERFDQTVAFSGNHDPAPLGFAPHVRQLRLSTRKPSARSVRAMPTAFAYGALA